MTNGRRVVEHVTCLGCGCLCDDIDVAVEGDRIVEARRACELGLRWFGDGRVSTGVQRGGQTVSVESAIDHAAQLLTAARRALVFLAPDISCETQRAAVAVADHLSALLDSCTSAAAAGVLAGQRRGRVAATLGEVRNRADVLVFWGVDPAEKYPRYQSRYAPDPAGLFVPDGRRGRTVVAVDIDDEHGDQMGPADADVRVRFIAGEEIDALALLRATLAGRTMADAEASLAARVAELVGRLSHARYAVLVHDAEPVAGGNPQRGEALIALVETLSASTRAALSSLRAGGNRNGADAVLTWQTGYPMAIDFARGHPRYRPDEGAARWLESGAADVALFIGNLRPLLMSGLSVPSIVIGPWATTVLPGAAVAIDTGIAGIHEGGIAFRTDDIPLPLRAPLPGPLDTASVTWALAQRVAHAMVHA